MLEFPDEALSFLCFFFIFLSNMQCFQSCKIHYITDAQDNVMKVQTKVRLNEFSEKMESLLEQQRRYHEERERLMEASVQVYTGKAESYCLSKK